MRAALRAAGGLLITACALVLIADPNGAPAEEPVPEPCTEIGCQSGLFLKLGPAKRAHPKTVKMKLCVNRKCKVFRQFGDPEWVAVVSTGKLGEKATVSMTLFGKRGRVLDKQRIKAPVTTDRPNGEDCPPVCYYVQAELNPKGRLVPIST